MTNKIFLIWIALAILLNLNTHATTIVTTPYIQNFTKKNYGAGPQNWQITKTQSGDMYFANNFGWLTFNGSVWSNSYNNVNNGITSLCEIRQDTLIVGGYGDFGILTKNKKGEHTYQSWIDKIPPQYQTFEQVWKIHKIDSLYFIQSFQYLFVFENFELKRIFDTTSQFKFSFVEDGKFYIQEMDKGLFQFTNFELKLRSDLPLFQKEEVWAMHKLNENDYMIGTQNKGLFLYDGKSIRTWDVPISDELIKNNLFCSTRLSSGNFAFGTIQDGVIISSPKGKILQHFTKERGLKNSTILSIFEDDRKNLWLGLDNGIDYVMTNSSLGILDPKGNIGTGYCAIEHNESFYWGTNQGLYLSYKKESEEIEGVQFLQIPEAKGQVWNLRVIEGKLFCCHNKGLFEIKGREAHRIEGVEGAWDILETPNGEGYIVGAYDGVYHLDKTGQLSKINGFTESSRNISFDERGRLWMAHGYKGVFNLKLDPSYKSLTNLKHYYNSGGIPQSEVHELFVTNSTIRCITNKGIYRFDTKKQLFEIDEKWNEMLDNYGEVSNIKPIDNTHFWVVRNRELMLLSYDYKGGYTFHNTEFLPVKDKMVVSFENIQSITQSQFCIGTEHGFILYKQPKNKGNFTISPLTFSSIATVEENTQTIENLPIVKNGDRFELPTIDYDQKQLRVDLSFPEYESIDFIQYRYRINESEWSNWDTKPTVHHSALKMGKNIIQYQATTGIRGISSSATLEVSINPPLLLSPLAVAAYFILSFFIGLILIQLTSRRIHRKRNSEIVQNQKDNLEREKALERQAKLAEAEIIQLKNSKLTTDIEQKSKELANTTMMIAQKNRVLREFKEVLEPVFAQKEQLTTSTMKGIIRRIDSEIEHQDNWMLFETNFDQVHENFRTRLKSLHPQLTPKDLRLAAYLRMNLSSKEIAPLLNISVRSVEISRYRIRKKIGLDTTQNLADYILSI